ncbi:S8 family peptidase [Delftia tsuruhatensis]|uniref:S8 family peptidase n=1 Tax=Delftia tsuruhatensis TaxID=180282 RepID=UPI002443ADD9|nr:S8 family peptidase [Delftia tsuruhatensis]MDH0773658.1 S8 family peptidase [Delftia tsuruhatensis]MDH1461406.1 S8 family peptidase [Delftia tsuruhatensis]MDH1822300.1 S8 family peptidase [Delftia tsuruhatensis]WGG11324.1 S8 family peptidase [Delftia tsuruhatensis]
MPDLDHLPVVGFTTGRDFQSNLSVRKLASPERDRKTHGSRLLQQLALLRNNAEALSLERAARGLSTSAGMVIAIEFAAQADIDFQKLEWSKDGIEVLTVAESGGGTNVVALHVPDGKLSALERRVEKYLNGAMTRYGKPPNANLVNAIDNIRSAAFAELWTEDVAPPASEDPAWLQIWLRHSDRPASEVAKAFNEVAEQLAIHVEAGYLNFPGRVVVAARTTRKALEGALRLLDCIAEIRSVQPHADFFLSELAPREQATWVQDLLQRCTFAEPGTSPYVTLLDTGLNRAHPLLEQAVAHEDVMAVEEHWGPGTDVNGHGTEMAGIICHGDLVAPLTHSQKLAVPHRMESVKIFPPTGANPPHLYGWVMAKAVNNVEQRNSERSRVFVTMTTAIGPGAGKPTEWSACVDQLAFGLNGLDPYTHGVSWGADFALKQRLFVLSAGNVPWEGWNQYPDINHATSIEDPGQSWNGLTVGACTHLTDLDLQRWPTATLIAQSGALSPASTTSRLWRNSWPLKPDVVAEGGNASIDDTRVPAVGPGSLRILTTSHKMHQGPFAETGDTSAAAAEVARICAHIRARYPDYWEETVRALVVHGARFTPHMQAQVPPGAKKAAMKNLLRTFGFGLASMQNSLASALEAPTLIVQDTIVPYKLDEGKVKLNQLKLHKLPWPYQELEALGEASVEMRVTLSYFVEPNPSRRGWQSKFRYQSHGLRFAVKGASEDEARFTQRINKLDRLEAEDLDEDESLSDPDRNEWQIGAQLRARGSVHSDVWVGTAAQLREKSHIAVFPVGGWWKDWPGAERADKSTRYSLVISLRTIHEMDVPVDLYTPIATEIAIVNAVDITT